MGIRPLIIHCYDSDPSEARTSAAMQGRPNENQQYQPPAGPPPQHSHESRGPYDSQYGSGSGPGYPPQQHGLNETYYGPPPGQYGQQQQWNQQQQQWNQQPQPGPYAQPPGPPYGQQGPYAPPTYGGSPPPLTPETIQSKPGSVPPGAAQEDERGLMGAIAGGAAGAYAGHKMHHGVIGALGGAYAGHKLEDKYKEHNKHKKEEKQHQQEQQQYQQQQHQYGPPPPYYQGGGQVDMRGNFSSSASGTKLDRDYDLIATCRKIDGSNETSALSLNKVLGNDDGRFVWSNGSDGNFGASARNVRLVDGRVLEAELRRVDGSWAFARVMLDERVGNNNGDLVFVR